VGEGAHEESITIGTSRGMNECDGGAAVRVTKRWVLGGGNGYDETCRLMLTIRRSALLHAGVLLLF
jgi:hypothetical protein